MSENTITLPVGIFKDGVRYRSATIRSMTGGTQRKLAQKNIRSDATKLINTLLLDCVVSIEGLLRINNASINTLCTGDRDALALEIRKLSRGNTLTTIVNCPQCKESLRITSNLAEEIEATELDDIDYSLVDDVPQFTLTDPNSDFTATFRIPDGNAQAGAMRAIQKNPVEGTYALMLNSLVSWNGKEPREVTLSVFDDLDINLTDYLMEEFQKHMPGPSFIIPSECSNCGKDLKLSMASSDFLFRLQD